MQKVEFQESWCTALFLVVYHHQFITYCLAGKYNSTPRISEGVEWGRGVPNRILSVIFKTQPRPEASTEKILIENPNNTKKGKEVDEVEHTNFKIANNIQDNILHKRAIITHFNYKQIIFKQGIIDLLRTII